MDAQSLSLAIQMKLNTVRWRPHGKNLSESSRKQREPMFC